MRKHLITPIPQTGTPLDEGWLNLDRMAVVEVTSEERDYPVDSAITGSKTKASQTSVRVWDARSNSPSPEVCSQPPYVVLYVGAMTHRNPDLLPKVI